MNIKYKFFLSSVPRLQISVVLSYTLICFLQIFYLILKVLNCFKVFISYSVHYHLYLLLSSLLKISFNLFFLLFKLSFHGSLDFFYLLIRFLLYFCLKLQVLSSLLLQSLLVVTSKLLNLILKLLLLRLKSILHLPHFTNKIFSLNLEFFLVINVD